MEEVTGCHAVVLVIIFVDIKLVVKSIILNIFHIQP